MTVPAPPSRLQDDSALQPITSPQPALNNPAENDQQRSDSAQREGRWGEWGWTQTQRRGLAILLTLLLLFLTIQYLRRPARLNDPAITHDPQLSLPERVDPNTATLQQLARIPHLGEKLAQKIL